MEQVRSTLYRHHQALLHFSFLLPLPLHFADAGASGKCSRSITVFLMRRITGFSLVAFATALETASPRGCVNDVAELPPPPSQIKASYTYTALGAGASARLGQDQRLVENYLQFGISKVLHFYITCTFRGVSKIGISRPNKKLVAVLFDHVL